MSIGRELRNAANRGKSEEIKKLVHDLLDKDKFVKALVSGKRIQYEDLIRLNPINEPN